MDWFSTPLDWVFGWLLPLFVQPHFATTLGMYGIVAFLVVFGFAYVKTRNARRSLNRRIKKLEEVKASNPDDFRSAFAAHWNDIDAVMSRKTPVQARPGKLARRRNTIDNRLADAWREFKETLVDETETPIRNTERPREYLSEATHPPHWLDLAANVFVGLGLVCTFLGLVAALDHASRGIAGGSVDGMQVELKSLLIAASTKFVTSIVGVLLSILLKLSDRAFARQLQHHVDRLCGLIEKGLLYSPIQKLAIDQLSELREQTTQIKTLSTELAVKIGDRLDQSFQSALAPVVQSFQTLNTTLLSAQEKQVEAIREGVRGSVSSATGAEFANLAAVLGELQVGLASMQGAVQSSGKSASEQIGSAAEQFGRVVGDMRTAFDEMANRMNSAGQELNRQAETQFGSVAARIETSLSSLQLANERQTRMLEESSGKLQQETHSAVSRHRGLMEETSQYITAKAGEAIGAAAGAARDQLDATLSSANAQLDTMTQRIAQTLNAAVSQMQAVVTGFDRVSAGVKSNADALDATAGHSRSASQQLGAAATAFGSAGVAANGSLSQLARVADQLTHMVSGVTAALEQARTLHQSISETQGQVSQAWESYRSRFADVDDQLGEATSKLGQLFSDAHERLKTNVTEMDSKLGSAVGTLIGFVKPLTDSAESLNDLAERMRVQRVAAAE